MARILVIEDEEDLQEVLAYNLRQSGHEPMAAVRGAEGLRLARLHRPDLIILDLMLPDIPGTEICKALKMGAGAKTMPILMLTARGEEIDRVVGFELGADDYVVKPFSTRELMLRIQAILRRGQPEAPERAIFESGSLRIDTGAHRVWVADRELELTALEFKLLVTLCDRRDRVQSRSVLLNDVWGIDAEVSTRTVDTHVKRLREKLQEVGEYIETVRGVGYRFAAAASPSRSRSGPGSAPGPA